MKQDIINLLRTNPNLTTNDIVNGSEHKKRGSVSKCLTRLVREKVVGIVYDNGSWRYHVLSPTPSPANSEVPATTNA